VDEDEREKTREEREVGGVTPPRALVVEDESVVRALVRDALIRAGFEVEESSDGLDAISRINDLARVFDVAFVDLGLLGVRGEEVVARAVEARPGLPVVVCTGEFGANVPGAAVVLGKPYKPSQIVALARRLARR
jgi:CheY-like chemotaxis protein